jgi:ParB/RepB/Spo0J family partition protein
MVEIELNTISRQYEDFRLKNRFKERELLNSIAEKGVVEPLACISKSEESYILLDGYKRLRCICKLKINLVPIVSIGNDEQDAILQLLRLSNRKSLQTLEQACFIDELHKRCGLSITGIALKLEVSPAWVSVRLGIIDEMSETVKKNIFSGRFPIRSYMYSIKHFTRVKHIEKDQIDRFISSVSGNDLSTRDIDTLAYGYFNGGRDIKNQIENGNVDWTLRTLKERTASLSQESDLSVEERKIINDLEILHKYILKVIRHFSDPEFSTTPFEKNACLLIEGIGNSITPLKEKLDAFHDR